MGAHGCDDCGGGASIHGCLLARRQDSNAAKCLAALLCHCGDTSMGAHGCDDCGGGASVHGCLLARSISYFIA